MCQHIRQRSYAKRSYVSAKGIYQCRDSKM